MNSFYTYMWLRADGTPYYVGKGTGNRAYSRFNHTVYPPQDTSRILVMERKSEAEAFASECELIANWGRLDLGTGCLRNMTAGGDGVPNRSPETNARISHAMAGNKYGLGNKSHTGQKHSLETKEKMSRSHLGKKLPGRVSSFLGRHHTDAAKGKLRAARLGSHHSEEAKQKISEALSKRVCSDETRAKRSAANKGHMPAILGQKHTPKTIAKMSEARCGYWEQEFIKTVAWG